ncbi:hypothetical protein FHX52_0745 [Humibacillus xanthopallidus]|uniref:Uncharacterized protein n=1 Tax=Humibacillus xanthopallidus TaxID=412689 RepID=A0A543PU88_9MICO|nr:hypothetical protein [Humibacillus xanthopallidus]TQN47642.1 hypothetical protein FHX52_0745 [Humibacillus xanthopallidus]
MSETSELARPPMAHESGVTDLRRARWLLALTPVGLAAGLLGVGALAAAMGVGVVSVVAEGAPATALQTALLILVGELLVLALPLASGLLAVRANRAGQLHTRSTLVAAAVVGALVAVLPVAGVPGGASAPSDDSWQRETVSVDLSGLPPGAYERGQTWPETRSSGVVIAVHTQWTTSRPPRQACSDFTEALRTPYPDTVLGPVDDLGCLVRADGDRLVVEIHGDPSGSGAVADVVQQAMPR